MNMCKLVLSLAMPSFVSNFNSRESKQTSVFFDFLIQINLKSKKAKTSFT